MREITDIEDKIVDWMATNAPGQRATLLALARERARGRLVVGPGILENEADRLVTACTAELQRLLRALERAAS